VKIGALIVSVFAVVWWVTAVWASGHGSVLMYGIPLVVSACVIVAAFRQPDEAISSEERKRIGRLVMIASSVEGVAIGIAYNVLLNIGKVDFFVCAVAMIVGLHFVPLARWMPMRLYYATAASLLVLGVAGCWIVSADQRILAVGISAACMLWLTLAVRLFVEVKRVRA
jgi:hypothetical protein